MNIEATEFLPNSLGEIQSEVQQTCYFLLSRKSEKLEPIPSNDAAWNTRPDKWNQTFPRDEFLKMSDSDKESNYKRESTGEQVLTQLRVTSKAFAHLFPRFTPEEQIELVAKIIGRVENIGENICLYYDTPDNKRIEINITRLHLAEDSKYESVFLIS